MASITTSSSLLRFQGPDPSSFAARRRLPIWKNTTNLGIKRIELPLFTRGKRVSRASFSDEAPFLGAIGASILLSLVFPVREPPEDNEKDVEASGFNFTDARFAVMGVLSVIPYFNWMSWIFAWSDTGRLRYLVYSAVYLAPYIKTNLSISPNESLLPLASYVACIVHVQLEESTRNGDIDLVRLLGKTLKSFLPSKEEKGPPRR